MKNLELLEEMIVQRYISVQKHPEVELFIYNYTAAAQYDCLWNEWTLNCRGLIMNADREIVARPFPKFFNLDEVGIQNLPNSNFEVYDKLDGSLGIMYFVENTPFIATRGSFQSDQAYRANQLLSTKYCHCFSQLNSSYTYLFEIIYPENRIVVDYGGAEELILIAIIDTMSGENLPLADIGFPLVKKYDGIKDIAELQKMSAENAEGFVIQYENGLRVKLKLEEYVRLHRIVTQISNIDIWEYLSEGKSFHEILDRVPDEFYNWVKVTKKKLELQYHSIEDLCKQEFQVLDSRKETAAYFLTCKYPAVLFLMLDGRDYSKEIWKRIRPVYERPFNSISDSV